MRKKFNNKGIGITAILALLAGAGVLAYGVGSLLVDDVNEALYGLLRSLLIWIDTQVYSVAAFAYSIFYELSSSSLLSSLNLASASQRLYTLLGIFMLFRLAFSFIKYIINPEGMEKGTSKLISNLAVSLALIVSVPWIFNRAFALQSYIMESNVIGNLIMGMNTTNKNDDNDSFNAASYGQSIGFLTFSAFFRPNAAIESLTPCSNLLTYYTKYVVPSGDKEVTVDPGGKSSTDAIIVESNKIAQCVNALNGNDNSLGSVKDVGDVEIGTIFYIASQRQNIGLFSSSGIINAKVGNSYIINYTAIVSTIAGGFLALLFLSFSFDVAIRNVKLCFLQIIAPIPIILNIEPGDTKSDKKPLNWWIKESLKSYTDLFIRVATVYFGVFLINVLFGSGDTVTGSTNTSVWFQVFMILGILLFVKQIPDLIGKAFGIDVKGQFNLNPLKRIGDSRLASMAVGGAAGLVTGLGTGVAAFRSARLNKANMNEALGRAFTGGIGGAIHSGISGFKKGAKSMHDITGNVKENYARSGRLASANVGTTLFGRTGARMAMATGAKTRAQQYEDTAAALEMPGKTMSSIKSIMNGDKTTVSSSVKMGAGTRTFRNAAEADDFLNSNSQLTDADRTSVMNARKAFEQAEKLRTSALTANGHRYQNYDEAMMAYANDSSLSMIDKHNLLNELNKRKTAISAATAAQTVSLDGETISNVKDANDYVERLRSSGAPEWAIKDAENQLSAIQAQRWSDAINEAKSTKVANVYSLARDEIVDSRNRNARYYDTYVVDSSGAPITNFDNWSNVKAAAGAGNLGAGAVRKQSARSKRNEEAAKAGKGK